MPGTLESILIAIGVVLGIGVLLVWIPFLAKVFFALLLGGIPGGIGYKLLMFGYSLPISKGGLVGAGGIGLMVLGTLLICFGVAIVITQK
jgi:hypothetical protein